MKKMSNTQKRELGESIKELGVSLVWCRTKQLPNNKIEAESGETFWFQFVLHAISDAPGMTVTLARRLVEDAIGYAVGKDEPTQAWASALMEVGKKWKFAQGWTEKQIKRLIDELPGDKTVYAKEWASVALTKDQAIAFEKLHANYAHDQERREIKLSKGRNVKPVPMSHSLLSFWN
jgi:hypothetical protein